MNEIVLSKLIERKGGFSQLFGEEYHNEAEATCPGDIIELFDSVDGQLMAHVCSECGAMRDE